MGFWIEQLLVEYQKAPIGLDERSPRFSWRLGADGQNVVQTACRILVERRQQGEEDGETVWDSGRIVTNRAQGIAYQGKELEACTRYQVEVKVENNRGETAEKTAFFETGMLDFTPSAWEGAEWIAAPRFTVFAPMRGVFVIESRFRLEKGSRRAGIVFGANDFRLTHHLQNEFGLEGENYIRYELNLDGAGTGRPALDIYRAGYAKEDRTDIPFASVPLENLDSRKGKPLLSEENFWEFHTLKVVVDGNTGAAYLDGVLVDGRLIKGEAGICVSGRVLNVRGENDVQTYPRLNEIGFFAGPCSSAGFQYLKVSNLRTPSRTFICETADGGMNGRESIFAGKAESKDGCIWLRGEGEAGTQITADPSNTSIPMFRRRVSIGQGKIRRARLYITSRGIYDCRINGKRVTDRLLAPGLTQYDVRMNYQTYDVTKLLKPGENALGVTLSSGWWSDAQTYTVKNYHYFGDKEALLCKLVIIMEDGSRQVVVSDTEHWKYYGDGPYVYAGLFNGEYFDSRKAWIEEDYAKPDFAEDGWQPPVTECPVPIASSDPNFGRPWPAVNQQEPVLEGAYDAPVYVVERRRAKSRREVEPGTWIYDLEQEMAGVPRITFHEKAGTKIIVRYAEMLYPDMPRYGENSGKIMVENYRDAASTDIYICCGCPSGETYQPRFTFHGYRYIQISGVNHPPRLEEVESLQYSSVTDMEGSFTSSHALLNRFAENVQWSQRCNFINIPTDCPQRNERMGWAGDTHVFCHTALSNSPLKLFYERNIQAMMDLQDEQGRFPEIAPIGGGFGGITYECASIWMTWEMYRQYGDIRTIERSYQAMKGYMDYLRDKGMPGKADAAVGPLADWLAPEETDEQLLWNAFYYRAAVLMEKMAHVLKVQAEEELQDEDAAEFGAEETAYQKLAEEIRKFWNHCFVEPETGRTRTMEGKLCDTQTSYAISAAFGITRNPEQAAEHLARKVKESGYRVGTGFFGTGMVNHVLSDYGYVEEAYRMMLQTECPSWLYPVTQGATTIWEHWDSFTQADGFGEYNSMNSFNHYSLGSVLSWMYEGILGIRRDEEEPGFRHVVIRPFPGKDLDYAEGSVSSPFGVIRSRWEKKENGICIVCQIPVNMRGTVIMPSGKRYEIGSGEYIFQEPIS